MQNGLDQLFRNYKKLIKRKKVAVLGHPASMDKTHRGILEALQEEGECEIIALFGPEHGFGGEAQDMETVTEQVTHQGIPTYSLYGSTRESLKPKTEWLKNVEVLLCDLQDVGARYYTFSYTIAFCMEVAAKTETHIIVLDRPNPINGYNIEGNVVSKGFRSFVGEYPIANRHGMTMGELAQMFREEFDLKCGLSIVPLKQWHRRRYFDECDLPWVLPSPNMPTVDTAVVYPGMCLLEGTELSEGRGTTRPFEIFGAPYVDPDRLVKRLREFRLPGVRFRPLYFKPCFQKHAGQVCGGAQLHVIKRKAFKPLLTGVAVLKAIQELYPQDFEYRHRPYEFVEDIPAIDLLTGNDQLRGQLSQGLSLKKIEASWEEEQQSFLEMRKKYLLYS